MNRRSVLGSIALAAYIACIFGANWALQRYGVLDWWGVAVPAGVLFVGLALTMRDLTQDALGAWPTLAAIAVGALLSWAVAPTFALASGIAFGFSELVDLAVYTPLRERAWVAALLASNVVGALVDSVIFLTLAFHSLEFLPGQMLGKLAMTAAAVAALAAVRPRWRAAVG